MQCSADDEGRPSGVAWQGETPNHRMLRRLRAEVVSDAGNGETRSRQVWIRKTNSGDASRALTDIKTEVARLPREEPGGCLFPGQAVSGVELT
jgi:hypothetical protein